MQKQFIFIVQDWHRFKSCPVRNILQIIFSQNMTLIMTFKFLNMVQIFDSQARFKKSQFVKVNQFNESVFSHSFSISALIDPPHDDDLITIFFRPVNQESSFDCMLLTTSKDGFIKSWVVSEQEILVKRSKDL